jgi:hypothetical protein
MADRSCDRNAGFLSLTQIPEELYIAGAIIVTLDEDGNPGVHFVAESLDEVPIPEVQAELGALVTQAWSLANNPGVVA